MHDFNYNIQLCIKFFNNMQYPVKWATSLWRGGCFFYFWRCRCCSSLKKVYMLFRTSLLVRSVLSLAWDVHPMSGVDSPVYVSLLVTLGKLSSLYHMLDHLRRSVYLHNLCAEYPCCYFFTNFWSTSGTYFIHWEQHFYLRLKTVLMTPFMTSNKA